MSSNSVNNDDIPNQQSHPLEGHYLVYQVLAGDAILYSELAPAREVITWPSFDVPPYTTHVEVSITFYGKGGEHIAMVRRTVHPRIVMAVLNTIPWKMREEYLAPLIGTSPPT